MIPFCSLDTKCPYLDDGRLSRTEYMFIEKCEAGLNSELVRRGFRRFGRYFQKPVCSGCNECISVKIDARNFKLSKSQRRVMRKNNATRYLLSRPIADFEHVELFRKYHAYMGKRRNWREYEIDLFSYYDLYAAGHGEFGKEISFYDESGELICVDLIDITNDGISSVYCYYDPDFSHLSLGKFSLLKEIELALNLGLRWIYLGYYVKGCLSLEYKKDFLPLKRLKNYSNLDETPEWVEFEIS